MKTKRIIENSTITVSILIIATMFCMLLEPFSEMNNYVSLVFVLAVVLVSRFTEGYVYGILASMIAVVGVNYVFTYPYFALNFSLPGYSITFTIMLGVACIVSALTTQIKKQEQIRLEVEKEKMRGNLLRAVSHDIRTPLTSIMAAASILESGEELSEDRKQAFASDIRSEAEWLIRIVENLLSVTRIDNDHGDAKIVTEEELVEEIISSAVMKFKKRFTDIVVSVNAPEDMLMVSMDGILIEQVLVNLMENAVVHGKTTTKIAIRVEEEPEQIRISVTDNGVGIKESALDKIFDGGMRTTDDSEVTDSKRNMGIGLSVCKTIIHAHKGHMIAENDIDGGARFIFWLPKTP